MVKRINVLSQDLSHDHKWFSFLRNNRFTGNLPTRLIVDFSKAGFLKPNHLTSLACLIEEYHMVGCKIEFVILQRSDVGKYLYNIRYNEYWESGFDRNAYTETRKKGTLCLWKVDSPLIDHYRISASDYYRNNYFEDYNLDMVSISLGEIFNNIYDHSKSKVTGYVLTQYYPKINELLTCVCDFGVGIPTSLNEYNKQQGKNTLPDNKALEEAFKWGVSSLSKPHNRGYGLNTLRSCVGQNNGSLRFFSNFAVYEQTPGSQSSYNQNISFPGTLIIIRLNTSNLPKFDGFQLSDMDEGSDNETFFFQ